jgi:hypothetical protein
MTDRPAPVAVRLARAFRSDNVTPQADRARRRIAAVGRGMHLGLDLVPEIALVRTLEHGDPGVTMQPGTIIVEVWGGEPDHVFTTIASNQPSNLLVVALWRPPTRWARVVAWWRYVVDELAGRWPVRITRARARARK